MTASAPTTSGWRRTAPGVLAALAVGALAYGLHYLPLPPFRLERGGEAVYPVSAALLAILLGVLVRNVLLHDHPAVTPGAKWITKHIIPITIVLFGFSLDLTQLAQAGWSALAIAVLSMAFALAAVYALGRLLRLNAATSLLLGAGTGVCGNAAIVAVGPVIKADDRDLGLSIGVVNLFGLLAMLACPLIGAALEMDATAFGVWAGATIHAVPQVVAAGVAYDAAAAPVATLVKLVRVALLAPLVLVIAVVVARRGGAAGSSGGGAANATAGGGASASGYLRLIPWFVYGFALASLLCSVVAPPEVEVAGVTVGVFAGLTAVGKLLLVLAMAAIGLEIKLRELLRVGARAVWIGLLSTLALLAFSFVLVAVLL